VILDLPLISNGPLYLLRKSFPGKQVVSWSRFRETPDLDSGDIFVLPNFAIEKLSRPENGRKVIFINTHSLGEMNDEISTNYMRHVDRLCDAAFTINRKKGKKRIQEVDMDVYSLLEVGKDWQKVHMGPSMPECKLGEWLAGYWEESVVKTARA
jgi:hypothetical protein